MLRSYLGLFVDVLHGSEEQVAGLISACRTLEEQPACEFARIMRAVAIEPADLLSNTKIPAGWAILPGAADADAFARHVLFGALHFVDPDHPCEQSSSLAAQVLLRTAPGSLPQVRRALAWRAVLPQVRVAISIARSAERLTAAVPLSVGLPQAGDPFDVVSARSGPSREFQRFVEELIIALRFYRELDPMTRDGEHIGSREYLRAALGRAGDHRTNLWLRGLGISMFDLLRVDHPEAATDAEIAGIPVSDTVWRIHCVATSMAQRAHQAISLERVIFASLATPHSWLAARARAVFGPAVNLPLLYLRTASPPGISLVEARALIRLGDHQCRPAPFPTAADTPVARLDRLRETAAVAPAFLRSRERFDRYMQSGDVMPTSPGSRMAPFRTGDAVELMTAARTGCQWREITRDEIRALVDAAALNDDSSEAWCRTRYRGLAASDPHERLQARLDLSACQTSSTGLRLLAKLGTHCREDTLALADAGDAHSAFTATRVAHSLESGVRPPVDVRATSEIRLFIGGGPERYVFGAIYDQSTHLHSIRLSEREAVTLWSRLRREGESRDRGRFRDALREAADAIGVREVCSHLTGRNVSITTVAPFDSLLLPQIVRSMARPATVTHRVFGLARGRWQGTMGHLGAAGGSRIVVSDPSATLRGARHEADLVAELIGADVIGGPWVLRAHLLRALEAGETSPQILHFAGHGVSGLIESSGALATGVLASDGEALTIESIANAAMPRILVASACDVGAGPPTPEATNWTTQAIAHGAAYSLSPPIPVEDGGAFVYMTLLYANWRRGGHLESIVGELALLGHDPRQLRKRWQAEQLPEPALARGLTWLAGAGAADVEVAMSVFTLAST
jgi:CHAT domain